MNLPDVNPGGYVNASISNVTGFHNVDYLLAHGSGDDNVHFSNSAHLLDMLTKEKVRNFRFRMFTDRWGSTKCKSICVSVRLTAVFPAITVSEGVGPIGRFTSIWRISWLRNGDT